MKQIQLVGPVDKRAVAYPLFKMCDIMGKTLVVTDDANFRRFSEDYSNEFTLGRSDFVITNDISQAVISDLGMKLNTYDYVIFINTNDLIDNNDCLVYCHGLSNLVCGDETVDYLDALEHFDVIISTHKPAKSKKEDKSSEKNEIFLSVDAKSFGYVWDCEEAKMFVPCKNADLTKLSNHLFGNLFGISAEDFGKTIVREV